MDETIRRTPSPEELKRFAVSREAGPEIAELERMIASFEVNHSLAELHAIGIDRLSPDLVEVFKCLDYLADSRRIENDIKNHGKRNPRYVETRKENIVKARAIISKLKSGNARMLDDARKCEIRLAAKKDMIPITEKLNNLQGNKNYERLKAKRLILLRAIGTLQGGMINHS